MRHKMHNLFSPKSAKTFFSFFSTAWRSFQKNHFLSSILFWNPMIKVDRLIPSTNRKLVAQLIALIDKILELNWTLIHEEDGEHQSDNG